MGDLIQADYEQLQTITTRFGREAEATGQTEQRLRERTARLRESWRGEGAAAFLAEMEKDVLPGMVRLCEALAEAQRTTQEIARIFRSAEEEAAALFAAGSGMAVEADIGVQSQISSVYTPQFVSMPFSNPLQEGIQTTSGPPPIPVPGAPPDTGWKWNPDPRNSRGGTWGPTRPVPVLRGERRGQPTASWDPEGHWDVDDGRGSRQRYDEDGNPISAEDAHNPSQNPAPSAPSPANIPDDLLERAAEITGLTGAALIIYLIVSEGLRILFPPRNLIPIP